MIVASTVFPLNEHLSIEMADLDSSSPSKNRIACTLSFHSYSS
eukprot:CAMPEP_0201633608 /NCGR_PEP_ID=MMETSP0493-20130528/6862_1 /ASSEMBLY_ACC=CAM_ASM_000838 /TAXON_ID=420259 /ORGANISM="Thalassiosira gravida, Strain GMp14c1" /LENGTH=42 /DNA_ID= /DNA_START= /DNA_END= /DNA_ORIENTATION=